jgi:hypothetical protein
MPHRARKTNPETNQQKELKRGYNLFNFFMLTAGEMQDVISVLGDVMLTVGLNDRATYLRGYLGTGDFQRQLNRLLKPASNHVEWAELSVQVCMERGWQDAPPSWMERLIGGIDAEVLARTRVPNVAAILARISAGPAMDPRLDATESELVLDDVPFLDRDEVRKGVRELLESGKRAVLVIGGEPGSGRSYCSELFQYISNQSGYFFKVAPVRIEPGQGRVYTPGLLALNIVGAMLSPATPPYVDPAHRTVEPYKNFVLTTAENSPHRWWILLDGFSDVPAENETRKLIQGLATSIANEHYRERLRLILVDYSGLQLSPLRYIPHKISPQSIGKKHIRSYFEKLKVKHKSPKTKEELDAFTDGIWDSLPNDATRLQVLNEQVSELALQVMQP